MLLTSQIILVISFWIYISADVSITQIRTSITKKEGNTAFLECHVKSTTQKKNRYLHWYRQKSEEPLQRILYISSNENVIHEQGFSVEKYEARKLQSELPASLRIHQTQEEDTALYYCACWDSAGWIKIFGEGTKLIVIPREKNLDTDLSPKPTVFLPSPAEVSLHQSGTYLCLLEKFFPEVIKIDWKEENSNTMLESQQGDVVKTGDTYTKFSWLTVTENSLDKKHKCIVKHEFNRGGLDQEIIFPSIKEDVTPETPIKEEIDEDLQLLFTNNSAYYMYFLLLFKSTLYFAIVTSCLFRTVTCSNGKNS